MAVRAGGAYIDIEAKLDNFKRDLDQKVVAASGRAAEQAGQRVSKTFRRVGAAIGGYFVLDKAINFAGDALAEARDAEKVARATDQVIKSTGGAAGVTAEQVSALAEKLSLTAGVDDDLIQKNENLLLTFTNVQNRVGEGNDIFDQATAAALDMSVAMGEDMKSSTIRLGKALNDPIKGLTSLSKVGVTFNDQQREQIKAMVEAGDAAGAQKVILAELNKEFGGQAAAQADAGDKLKVAWDNAKETLGKVLLPVVQRVSTWLAERLPGAVEKTRAFFDDKLKPVLRDVFDWMKRNVPPIVRAVGTAFREVGEWLAENVPPVWRQVRRVIAAVVDFIKENWPKVRDIIVKASTKIKDITEKVWPKVRTVIVTTIRVVRTIIETFVKVGTVLWETFGRRILAAVKTAFNQIRLAITTAINVVRGIIKTVTSLIRGDWDGVWNGIKATVGAVWDFIRGTVSNGIDAVKNTIGTGLAAIGLVFSATWDGVKAGAQAVWDAIVGIFRTLRTTLGNIATGIGDAITAPIKLAWNALAGVWNSTIGAIDVSIPSWVPVVGGKGFEGPELPILHDGGVYRSPRPGGEGLAMLRDGEVVLTPEQARAMGGAGRSVTFITNYRTDPDQLLGALRRHERLYA